MSERFIGRRDFVDEVMISTERATDGSVTLYIKKHGNQTIGLTPATTLAILDLLKKAIGDEPAKP